MRIPVHADDQLWSVDDVSTYLTVPAATLLRRTTRRRFSVCGPCWSPTRWRVPAFQGYVRWWASARPRRRRSFTRCSEAHVTSSSPVCSSRYRRTQRPSSIWSDRTRRHWWPVTAWVWTARLAEIYGDSALPDFAEAIATVAGLAKHGGCGNRTDNTSLSGVTPRPARPVPPHVPSDRGGLRQPNPRHRPRPDARSCGYGGGRRRR